MLNQNLPRQNAGRLEYFDGAEWVPLEFTREDVRILRHPHRTDSDYGCSMWWLSDYPGAQTCDCGDEQKLRDIAARIEALLPPE